MEPRYDLHMHSIYSDGTDAPKELIDKAKELGLSGISITDHDTIAAYNDELFDYAKQAGIELIVGVEFSTTFEKHPIHILGYNFRLDDTGIKKLTEMHKERRRERNLGILELLGKRGIKITEEELHAKGQTSIGRPHIAMVMVEKGYVDTVADAFQQYIGDSKPCWLQGRQFSVQETIATIHGAKGSAVFAHPILLKRKNMIRKVAALGFDGMECYYARFSKEQCQEMQRIAERYELLITGGSDYHGHIKEFNRMGSSFTNQEDLQRLKNAQNA